MMTKEELRAYSRPALPKRDVGMWSPEQLKMREKFARHAAMLPGMQARDIRSRKNKNT
ncbi:MAG: hypothetical protein V4594_05650 [Bacteroidota bacterium]